MGMLRLRATLTDQLPAKRTDKVKAEVQMAARAEVTAGADFGAGNIRAEGAPAEVRTARQRKAEPQRAQEVREGKVLAGEAAVSSR